jgi:hypothetical protein
LHRIKSVAGPLSAVLDLMVTRVIPLLVVSLPWTENKLDEANVQKVSPLPSSTSSAAIVRRKGCSAATSAVLLGPTVRPINERKSVSEYWFFPVCEVLAADNIPKMTFTSNADRLSAYQSKDFDIAYPKCLL